MQAGSAVIATWVLSLGETCQKKDAVSLIIMRRFRGNLFLKLNVSMGYLPAEP